MTRSWDLFKPASVWLTFTFVGRGAEAGQTRQQHRQAVLRPAVWKHASVVTETRIWVVWNVELQSVWTCEFAVLTFFICRPEHPVV